MLRRIRVFIATSLDGYIAGPGDTLDWLFTDDGYGYDEFLEQVDLVAMGRRTYDIVKDFGEWPYAGLPSWVFTRRTDLPTDPRVTFTALSPAGWAAARGAENGRDIYLVGGGELLRGFLDANLVDTVEVAVHPVILGGGRPLIPAGTSRHRLRLASSRAFPSGLVMNHYAVTR